MPFSHSPSPKPWPTWIGLWGPMQTGNWSLPSLQKNVWQTSSPGAYMSQQPLCLPRIKWEREIIATFSFFLILLYGSWVKQSDIAPYGLRILKLVSCIAAQRPTSIQLRGSEESWGWEKEVMYVHFSIWGTTQHIHGPLGPSSPKSHPWPLFSLLWRSSPKATKRENKSQVRKWPFPHLVLLPIGAN